MACLGVIAPEQELGQGHGWQFLPYQVVIGAAQPRVCCRHCPALMPFRVRFVLRGSPHVSDSGHTAPPTQSPAPEQAPWHRKACAVVGQHLLIHALSQGELRSFGSSSEWILTPLSP